MLSQIGNYSILYIERLREQTVNIKDLKMENKNMNLDTAECWNCDLTFDHDVRFTMSSYDYDYDGNTVFFEVTSCPNCDHQVRVP